MITKESQHKRKSWLIMGITFIVLHFMLVGFMVIMVDLELWQIILVQSVKLIVGSYLILSVLNNWNNEEHWIKKKKWK